MNLMVKKIPASDVPSYWPQCEVLLTRGLADSEGEVDAEHVLAMLQAQQLQLLTGVDAAGAIHVAIAVQFIRYPNYTVAHIFSIGGQGVMENAEHWAGIKAWMREQGATRVQGVCKPAQARLWRRLGLTPVYQVVQQSL